MSTRLQVTLELLNETGRQGQLVQEQVYTTVGDVTVDVLSQNDCRFRRLKKQTTLTFAADSTTPVKVPADFKTISKNAHRVDAAGDFLARVEFVDETEFYERKGNSAYGGDIYFTVEERSDGEYVVINAGQTAITYIRMWYYRQPTPDDTDIITSPTIVKEGVRPRLPKLFPEHINGLPVYEAHKLHIKEHPGQRATSIAMKPNKRTQGENRLNWKVGRGQ